MGTDSLTFKIKIELKDYVIAYHGYFARHANLHRQELRDDLLDSWTTACKLFNAVVDTSQYDFALSLLYDHVQRNKRNPFKSLEDFDRFMCQKLV